MLSLKMAKVRPCMMSAKVARNTYTPIASQAGEEGCGDCGKASKNHLGMGTMVQSPCKTTYTPIICSEPTGAQSM